MGRQGAKVSHTSSNLFVDGDVLSHRIVLGVEPQNQNSLSWRVKQQITTARKSRNQGKTHNLFQGIPVCFYAYQSTMSVFTPKVLSWNIHFGNNLVKNMRFLTQQTIFRFNCTLKLVRAFRLYCYKREVVQDTVPKGAKWSTFSLNHYFSKTLFC